MFVLLAVCHVPKLHSPALLYKQLFLRKYFCGFIPVEEIQHIYVYNKHKYILEEIHLNLCSQVWDWFTIKPQTREAICPL